MAVYLGVAMPLVGLIPFLRSCHRRNRCNTSVAMPLVGLIPFLLEQGVTKNKN